jgi:hypothetical protein
MDDTGRSYSLRKRNARQLNPYFWDQRFYKNQLRGNRDAIVPSRDLELHQDHRSQRNPNQNGDDEDNDEFIVHETQEDSQDWEPAHVTKPMTDTTKRSERMVPSNTARSRGVVNVTVRANDAPPATETSKNSSWLPKALQDSYSSDEEQPFERPLHDNGVKAQGSNKAVSDDRGMKRRKRVQRFPLRLEETHADSLPLPQAAISINRVRLVS